MTINEFIAGNELRLDILPAHENPYRAAADQMNAIHWSCQLANRDSQSFVIYFSKGPGLRVWIDAEIEDQEPVPTSKVGTPYDGPMPPFEDELNEEIFLKRSTPQTPRFSEILICLVNDIRTVDQCLGFDDWCARFKWSMDSRHARKCYDGVCEQAMKLRALLRLDQYEILLHNIDEPETQI